MKLRVCVQCGGPRRSLSVEICSRCRKHPKDACPDCGAPKGVEQARCHRCQARIANAAHADAHPSQGYRAWHTDTCPKCGSEKRREAAECAQCYRAKVTKRPEDRVRIYRMVWAPDHPLAMSGGQIMEHRRVLFEKIGPGEHPCHWCGKIVQWIKGGRTRPGALVADHLDGDKTNNAPENLVPSCHACNAHRVS